MPVDQISAAGGLAEIPIVPEVREVGERESAVGRFAECANLG